MKLAPKIIPGGRHEDLRGVLGFNNSFDMTAVKRLYTISNTIQSPNRGWQGHKVESRWFSSLLGSFEIALIAIDNWDNPPRNSVKLKFMLQDHSCDVLHIPPGYVSCIKMLDNHSKLLVFSDYTLGEINDEFRYDINHFK